MLSPAVVSAQGADSDDPPEPDAEDLTPVDATAPAPDKKSPTKKPKRDGPEQPKPPVFGEQPEPVEEATAREMPKQYPRRLVDRPLTLWASMLEIGLTARANVDPGVGSSVLQARYGVTDQIELSLAYGIGSVDGDGFTGGKSFHLRGSYTLIPQLVALEMTIPVLVDPFAIAISFGAPVQLHVGDTARLFVGRDLINFRLHRFVPEVDNPLATQALIDADSVNTDLSRGDIRIIGGAEVQLSAKTAVIGELGVIFNDFSNTDPAVPLAVTLLHTPRRWFDVGIRTGFGNLDQAKNTFGASIVSALRL